MNFCFYLNLSNTMLHILLMQYTIVSCKCGILVFQSVVNDLAPLLLSTKPQILQRFPSHMIEAAQQPAMPEEEPSKGAGLNSNPLSVDDRRALYDFVVEVLKIEFKNIFPKYS